MIFNIGNYLLLKDGKVVQLKEKRLSGVMEYNWQLIYNKGNWVKDTDVLMIISPETHPEYFI